MSFIEDAVLNAKTLSSAVTEKAGKLMDISRLRLSAAEITKDISRRYEAMGRAIYDARKAEEDTDGIIAECVIGLDALYTRLDDVNTKIARLQDKKYCTSCGALIDESSLFCSRCGSRITHEKAKAENEPKDTGSEKNAEEQQ